MIINAWLIKSRKSAANLTFSKWKQKTTGRNKSAGNTTNISQSVLDHQAAMAITVDLFKTLASAVKIGYKQFNSTIGNYAAFVKDILDNAFDFSTPGTPVLDPDMVVVAKGSMPATAPTLATSDNSAGTVIVTFPTAVGYGQATSDKISIAIYNETKSTWKVYTDVAARSTGTATVTPGSAFLTVADVLAVHTFFAGQPSTPTAGKVSDDAVIASTVVA